MNRDEARAGRVRLATGAIRPQGWILEQLRIDLAEGLTGAFDTVTSNVSHELFAAQERRPGTWVTGSRGAREKAWWAGEHEGYWLDGFVRSAILTADARRLEEIEGRVERILRAFARTGYVGIYTPQDRLPDRGFDAELWTQSRIFQALLAWYEYRDDARIPQAVSATVTATIDRYQRSTYFGRPGADGGVAHGVGYIDTLEWMHRLTGESWYADAAAWLYDDYCAVGDGFFTDLAARRMRDPRIAWFDHAAHVAEALHFPAIAGALSGRHDILDAAANVHTRLARHTNPGGGLAIGELEFIRGAAGGGHRPSETCANVESAISLGRLAARDPSAWVGDLQERVILNAVQGARLHPSYGAAAYLTRDNRRHAADADAHAGRELFSPCHEAAACCVLNVPRAMPYYVDSMWYRLTDAPGLAAHLYGPCSVETQVGGVEVRIDELTAYPFSDEVDLIVVTGSPVDFELRLRVPEGSGDPEVRSDVGVRVVREPREICLRARWSGRSRVRLRFHFEPRTAVQPDGTEAYRCWGPLVFALPFAHRPEERAQVSARGHLRVQSGEHAHVQSGEHASGAAAGLTSGFPEYLMHGHDEPGWQYLTHTDDVFRIVRLEGDARFPWVTPPVGLEGPLRRPDGGLVGVRLLPMGSSPLRRVTFPVHPSVPADPKRIAPSADGMREA